jgi:XTP/dITP diphosphohydrolase
VSVNKPLVFATRNHGKLAELRQLLSGFDVLSIDEAQLRLGVTIDDVVEDADTFIGNASKKALEVSLATGLPALADDSGLCVDALHGDPGVYSARYAGQPGNDAANNAKLLAALANVNDELRTARFHCALVLADVKGHLGQQTIVAEATCEGVIVREPRGNAGFGYDPLFYFPPMHKTFAELGIASKGEFSHRARAMQKIATRLRDYLAG